MPPPSLQHSGQHRAYAVERPFAVDLHGTLPLLCALVLHQRVVQTPAQLTRISTGPSSSSARATSERTSSRSVTSVGKTMHFRPSPLSSPAWISKSASSRRAASATCAPSAFSALATVAPMPLEAPVTTATLFRRDPTNYPLTVLVTRIVPAHPKS